MCWKIRKKNGRTKQRCIKCKLFSFYNFGRILQRIIQTHIITIELAITLNWLPIKITIKVFEFNVQSNTLVTKYVVIEGYGLLLTIWASLTHSQSMIWKHFCIPFLLNCDGYAQESQLCVYKLSIGSLFGQLGYTTSFKTSMRRHYIRVCWYIWWFDNWHQWRPRKTLLPPRNNPRWIAKTP